MKVTGTTAIFLFALALPAAADGILSCERGNARQRLDCFSNAVGDLESTVAKLATLIGTLEEKVKALEEQPRGVSEERAREIAKEEIATDKPSGGYLRYGAPVSIQNEGQTGLCMDLRSQDNTSIQAWRCNNDNNHQRQHWVLVQPN